MNPQSPREELEIRITALLMGELSPEEATALLAQIAGDAELAALHARLARALGLLREASAIPEHPAPPALARLSDERRARLLAHFKGEAMPGPVIVKPRREWKWAVPLGLAASLMALIGGAMFVNGFALRKGSVITEAVDFFGPDGERSSNREEFRAKALAGSAVSTVMSQIRDATDEKGGSGVAWASQPGMIRTYRTDKGDRDSKETNRFHRWYSSVDEAPSLTANSRAPELNLFGRPRETNWDTPRSDESRPSEAAPTASAAGVLYLPKGATEESESNLDAGIKAFASASIPKPPGAVSDGWAKLNEPADPTAPASLSPNSPPAPVFIAAADSAPGAGSSEVMHRKLHLDISGLKSGVTGLPALADSEEKGTKGGDNAKSPIVDDLAGGIAGAGSKEGKRAIVVLSDSATETAGTAIADGTLRFSGDIAQRGMAVVPVPQPTTAPKTPPAPAMPEPALRLIHPENLGDSQVALGRFQGEIRVADSKPAAKMDGATDGLAVEGRDKQATTSLGLAFGNTSDLYEMAQRKDAKGDAVNGRAEAAAIDAVPRADGTKIAAGRPFGENMNASASEFSTTPATPMVSALGNKSVLSPDVVEFEGFVNHGARVQSPAPAKPASGPAPTAQAERFKESADFGTVAGSGAVTLNKSGATHWSFDGGNTFTGGTTVNAGTLSVDGAEAQSIPANRESDRRRTLGKDDDGAMNGKDARVTIVGSDRADIGVKREFGDPKKFDSLEIPKSFDGEWAGRVTKAGTGTLNLASGGTLASPVDAPVAKPAPRGGDAVDGVPQHLNEQITPQHRAKMEEVKAGVIHAEEYKNLGRYDLADRKYAEVLDKDPHNAAASNGREELAQRKDRIARADYEATRSAAIWEVNKERARPYRLSDLKPGDAKDVPKQREPAFSEKSSNDGQSKMIVESKFTDIRQNNVEELDFSRLNRNPDVPLLGDIPVTGRLFRTEPHATKPAAPAEETAVTLHDGDKRKKSGDSKDAEVALGAVSGLEMLTKDVAPVQRKQVEAKLKPAKAEAAKAPKEMEIELKGGTSFKVKISPAGDAAKPVTDSDTEKAVEQLQERVERTAAPNPLIPQSEIATGANAFSTFSLNVSDVAFKLAAASLERGTMPDVSTLRTEEFINAFDYRDPEARAGAPLAFASERARYPFAQNRDVVRFSVKTAAAGRQPGRPLNVVLLLDNSGSMERADRIRILQEGLRTLSAQLQPQDKLSVVTFARTPRLWADGVAGDKAGEVTARVGEITPEGGTNLAAALDLGYATALKHYQPGSINHVVLLTDGAANLGNVDPSALKQKVEAHRKQGIALDCFGIGWEGLNDDMLEQLSRNGDGRYGFINTPEEAATKFAGQLAGALRVAASDVKVQVEWNPKRVSAYRQVGYAKHQLTKEQFRDNTVDAAELTAAESGNALYVVEVNPQGQGDLATVRVRFKVPGTSDYREHEWAVPFTGNAAPLEQSSSTLRLAGTAAAFSEMLASSPFATEVTSDRLLGLLTGVPAIYGADARPKKLEWMIRQAKSLSGR